MMNVYESLRHPETFIHVNMEDLDPKTKTITYLDADGKIKSMSIATLKRWYKKVDDWDSAMAREAEPEATEPETTETAETAEPETVEVVPPAELAETEAPAQVEAAEPETEAPAKAKRKNMARKPKSLKITELTWNNETKSLRNWAKELNLPYPTLYDRINRNGWSVEDAIRVPLGMSRKEFKATA